ncbi:MAG: PDZ domain-containing protein [Acidobacteriota bacterium]|nr:PDZ domain-containing protein [Acidobacteriota bacterium]
MAIVAAASVAAADGPKCNGAARECEQQIRQMLSGRRYLGATIEDQHPGLIVKSVIPKSPAERAGLLPGDVLIALNGKSLVAASARDFKQMIADARATGRLWMIIARHGAYSKVETRLEPYTKEQIAKIVAAHLSQSHPTTAGAQ